MRVRGFTVAPNRGFHRQTLLAEESNRQMAFSDRCGFLGGSRGWKLQVRTHAVRWPAGPTARVKAIIAGLRGLGARLRGNCVGATAVFLALVLSGLIGLAGLGTEAASWYFTKRAMQGAADAGATTAAAALARRVRPSPARPRASPPATNSSMAAKGPPLPSTTRRNRAPTKAARPSRCSSPNRKTGCCRRSSSRPGRPSRPAPSRWRTTAKPARPASSRSTRPMSRP